MHACKLYISTLTWPTCSMYDLRRCSRCSTPVKGLLLLPCCACSYCCCSLSAMVLPSLSLMLAKLLMLSMLLRGLLPLMGVLLPSLLLLLLLFVVRLSVPSAVSKHVQVVTAAQHKTD